MSNEEEQQNVIQLGMAADANAVDTERLIKSAYVYIYNAATDKLENEYETLVPARGDGSYIDAAYILNRKWRVKAGDKKVYVVINPQTMVDATGRAFNFGTDDPLTVSALLDLRTKSGEFLTDYPDGGTADGMLMTGMGAAPVTPTHFDNEQEGSVVWRG